MKRSDIAICIPSSRRPESARRVLSTVIPSATVFVAEQELDAYLAIGVPKEKLQTHPNLFGLARIRNWIVAHSGAEVTVQVDDDFHAIYCWPGRKRRVITEPDRIEQVIFSLATVAKDAGARLFGWSNAGRPHYYSDGRPFEFRGPVGRAFGVIGKEVKWDERLITMVDTDATLEELKTTGFVLIDDRLYFHCGAIYGNRGGMQAIRTNDLRQADEKLMLQKWGERINISERSKTGTSTNTIRKNPKKTARAR
jgi:hypothetical protein